VSEPLVIVGNGMTAARLVDELTRYALARHAIGVIGDEQRLAYNRVLLSSVLAGETAPEDIKLKADVVVARSGRYLEGWLPGNRA
jgi:nitrite reductase (NADH) large subunit